MAVIGKAILELVGDSTSFQRAVRDAGKRLTDLNHPLRDAGKRIADLDNPLRDAGKRLTDLNRPLQAIGERFRKQFSSITGDTRHFAAEMGKALKAFDAATAKMQGAGPVLANLGGRLE